MIPLTGPTIRSTDAVKVYRRVEGAFGRAEELSAETGDTLTTPLLPGWSAALPEILASAL